MDQEWARAACAGPTSLQKHLSKASKLHRSPRLDIRSDDDARDLLEHRRQSGSLDSHCSDSAEAAMQAVASSILRRARAHTCGGVASKDLPVRCMFKSSVVKK